VRVQFIAEPINVDVKAFHVHGLIISPGVFPEFFSGDAGRREATFAAGVRLDASAKLGGLVVRETGSGPLGQR